MQTLSRLSRRHGVLAIAVGAAYFVACPGCGKADVKTVPVRGRITYGGGDWPAPGKIYFVPVDAATGNPRRPGSADFDTGGHFEAKTFAPGDGLLPGKYHVNLECWEVEGTMSNPAGGKSWIPAPYQSAGKNKFEVIVGPDDSGPIEVSFDVPKR